MKVTGTRELTRRLVAVQGTPQPAGRAWAEEAVSQLRASVRVRTGQLRRSFQVGRTTSSGATVTGHSTAYPLDAGQRPHLIKPRRADRLRWQRGGRTIFARKVSHPGARPTNFRMRAAREALRRRPVKDTLVDRWNRPA